jgi:heterodisulfide reductase subunit C
MSFAQDIEALSGQRVNLCFQCGKCSSGCPMADWMDLKPAQVVHNIRLDREQAVLSSAAIWYCLGCETCSARCPQGLEPAALMNAARILAASQSIQPRIPEATIYYRGFVDNLRWFGRIHDASLIAVARLLAGHPFDDLPLAFQLLKRGRLSAPPWPTGGASFRRLYGRVQKREKALR